MQLTGKRIGQIRVSRFLGRGGMGAVYEGFHEKLARRVALKVMHGEQRLGSDARARMAREARTLSQLDHPNICRIYDFIEHESGDILVLELIEGRTLHQAIRDGLTRAEKLRIAGDIAAALVAAHRAGIIHRDLKPENVMVTNSGDVKILDFGLARWVESATPAAAVEPGAGTDGDLETDDSADDDSGATAMFPRRFVPARLTNDAVATAFGAAVGTPTYMSPEQARGETLTAASDIYSFGLVLQVLFTERLPYRETGAREVMARAARGETLAVTGVARNITLLIDRLKALAPSDRPTALDASQQLRRIVDRPKRMAQRAAITAAVLLAVIGIWKYTIDLRRERTAAVAAESEARRRRADADGLITFMLGDLRTKLEPVGRLDVLDAAASRSLAYLSSLRAEHMTAAELAGTAKALNQLGEVRIAQGNLAAASAAFEKALTFAAAAVARAPQDSNAQLSLGTTHFWIGDVGLLRKDLPSALQHMDAYRAIAEKLSRSHPGDSAMAIERAEGEADVGAVIEAQGDLRGALKHYETTLAIDRSEAIRHPDNVDLQAELARMANKIGVVRQKLGDLVEARRQFEIEVATYEAVLQKQPAQNQWRQRLSSAHSFLASVLEDLGDERALSHRQTEVAMDVQLCKLDPSNADWQRNLAVASAKLGALLRARDPHEAVSDANRAQTLMSALVAKDPRRSSWRIDLGAIRWYAARVYLATGDRAAARSTIEGALSTLGESAQDPAAALRIGEALITSGDIFAGERDPVRAHRAWSSAVQTLRPFAAGATEARFLAAWARALSRLGRSDEARPVLERLAAMRYANSDVAPVASPQGHSGSSQRS